MIVCICRGKSERDIERALDSGAESLFDLQRCGIGDQCGSCHNSLRAMIVARAAKTAEACPVCVGAATAVPAMA